MVGAQHVVGRLGDVDVVELGKQFVQLISWLLLVHHL